MNFTNLNDACSKDTFALRRIDMLTDATDEHEMLSCMDDFIGYYQIKMHKEDLPKVSLIFGFGVYFYFV